MYKHDIINCKDIETKVSIKYLACPRYGVKFELPEEIEMKPNANEFEVIFYILGKLLKLKERGIHDED